jgi:hypothetical protein
MRFCILTGIVMSICWGSFLNVAMAQTVPAVAGNTSSTVSTSTASPESPGADRFTPYYSLEATVSFNVLSFDNERLSSQLREQKIEGINNTGFSINSGLTSWDKNGWMSRITLGLMLFQRRTPEATNTHDQNLSGLNIEADLAYAIVNTERFRLYPMLGNQLNLLWLNLSQKTTAAAVLSNPRREAYSDVTMWSLLINFKVGIGADYKFYSPTDSTFSTLGIETGFAFGGPPSTFSPWRLGSASVQGLSGAVQQGIYARIVVSQSLDWYVQQIAKMLKGVKESK